MDANSRDNSFGANGSPIVPDSVLVHRLLGIGCRIAHCTNQAGSHGAFIQTPKNPPKRPGDSDALLHHAHPARQDRKAVSTSRHSGIVKLPVVDKQDIRFLPFSVNGGASEPDQEHHAGRLRLPVAGDHEQRVVPVRRVPPRALPARAWRSGQFDAPTASGPFTRIAPARSGSERRAGSTALDATQRDVHTLPSRPCERPELEPGPGARRPPGPRRNSVGGHRRRARPDGPLDRRLHPLSPRSSRRRDLERQRGPCVARGSARQPLDRDRRRD